MAGLEYAHDFAERNRLRRPCQTEAAADTSLGGDESAIGEVAHHFGQMIARNAEFGGDLVGGKRPRRLARQPH